MSKFDKCVQQAIDAGKLSPKLAEALRVDALVFEAKLRAQGIHSKEQAKLLGAEQAAEHRKLIAMRNKYKKVLQHSANSRNVENITSHPKSKAAGLMSLMVKDLKVHRGKTAWSNIDNRSTAIEGQAHSLMADLLMNSHTTKLGWSQDRALLKDTVREIHGQSTGNAKAKQSAESWAKSSEYLRERYNRAGGFIAKRNDYGMPQTHDQKKVAKSTSDKWIEYVTPLLNREAMVNAEGRIMSDAELLDGLREAFTSISTGGQNKKVAGQFSGGGSLSNRHQESRFLIFKDAESWIDYQEEFGSPDFFNTMTGHVRGMASEIAMLEVLGPNPNHAYKYLRDMTEDDGNMGLLDSVWDVVNGSADMISVNRESIAKGTAATRHLLMSAQLGGAAISAITDPVYGKMTRAFNGIPSTKMFMQTLNQLNPADESDRAFAAHMGLVMDGMTSQALAGSRFSGEIDPAGNAAKVSETIFRASGLTSWTNSQRNAFGLDFQWHLGRQMGKSLIDVETKFQSAIRRYGITDEDWEIMRSAPLEEHGGATYFRPQNLNKLDLPASTVDNIATKVLEAMNTEMDFAVPTPDARVRAITTGGGAKRGTAFGEIARMGMMYKSFSITQFNLHMNRSGPKFAGVYALRLGISLTLMGAVALQMKEVSKGREPRDMESWEFWGAAMMQGGGLGIFGDFISTSGIGNNRYGNSVIATAAGPAGSLVEDTFRLAGSLYDLSSDPFTGDDTNFGREATRLLKRYTPANNLWYARLLLERGIFDNLEEMADPKAKQNRKKYERKMKTERGQDYWWKKGESAPSF